MTAVRDVLIATTDTIPGWEVYAYVGLISTHSVIGTGFFTDLAASITDMFGVRSGSYRNKMLEVEADILDELRSKAYGLRAEAIIGVRIDDDEISGGGKSMMMVTAAGTAVRARPIAARDSAAKPSNTLVSAAELALLIERERIMRRLDGPLESVGDSTWDFVIQNRVADAASALMRYYDSYPHSAGTGERIRAFVRSLPAPSAAAALYGALRSGKYHSQKLAIELIHELSLFDLNFIHELLNSPDESVRHEALQVTTADKVYYSGADVDDFRELIDLIKSRFPVVASFGEGKSLLGTPKRVWKCQCSAKNDQNVQACGRCGRDVYGFRDDEISPPTAVDALTKRIKALSNYVA